MSTSSKLAIGPMSSEVIEAVFKYSQKHDLQLMLIASKSQIDHCGGYVNNWNTYQYADFLRLMREKYRWAKVLVCRDHCGPGFSNAPRFSGSKDLDDTLKTIEADLFCNFDLIHIDLCFMNEERNKKLNYSRDLIEFILKQKPEIYIEVGTDENTGDAVAELDQLSKDVDFFLDFCKPEFYVVQTGSLVKEINQTGTFDRDVTSKVSDFLHSRELKLKEHNADYLNEFRIALRRGVVDAMNIAPMMGVLQTQYILTKCIECGVDATEFLERSYNSNKWGKWLCRNDSQNKHLCALIAGHYNFHTPEYSKIIQKLEKCHIGLKRMLVELHMEIIDRYMVAIEGKRREIVDYAV